MWKNTLYFTRNLNIRCYKNTKHTERAYLSVFTFRILLLALPGMEVWRGVSSNFAIFYPEKLGIKSDNCSHKEEAESIKIVIMLGQMLILETVWTMWLGLGWIFWNVQRMHTRAWASVALVTVVMPFLSRLWPCTSTGQCPCRQVHHEPLQPIRLIRQAHQQEVWLSFPLSLVPTCTYGIIIVFWLSHELLPSGRFLKWMGHLNSPFPRLSLPQSTCISLFWYILFSFLLG